MVGHNSHTFSFHSTDDVFTTSNNGGLIHTKKKRKPAGTPDPDAEVIYLCPEMLMESDRFVCEICNQSFQREQNLQMHRRRHKVPWKLLKRETEQIRKRVYVCPEPTCLHHDPGHALGDLVGIKKHFKRKHSNKKQWACEKCSKGYAVHSDFKAHIKICGTRGHSCDCGRVFSRVEAFIEHQDTCNKSRMENFIQLSGSGSGSGSNPSCSKNYAIPRQIIWDDSSQEGANKDENVTDYRHNLELQLFSSSSSFDDMHISNNNVASTKKVCFHSAAAGPFVQQDLRESERNDLGLYENSHGHNYGGEENVHGEMATTEAYKLRCEAQKLSKLAMEQKALAEEKKHEARCLIGLAMQEMGKAKEIKEEAIAEFNAAQYLKACATRRINNTNVLQIKCNACTREFPMLSQETSYGGETLSLHPTSFQTSNLEGGKGNKSLRLWTRGT